MAIPKIEWGLLVTYKTDEGPRTYACLNEEGLAELILRLTGRSEDTFAIDARGFPKVPGMTIAYPLHIYMGGSPS